jgi:hypothetical protein
MKPMKFQPTYLYIKQHSKSGLLYFGKTIKKDPVKYKGSGIRWSRHVNKHGIDHVETLWYCLFYDQEELMKFALMCSEMWNIVKSDEWLNLTFENGIGGLSGYNHSKETKALQSMALKNRSRPEAVKQKMRGPRSPMSEEGKMIRSVSGKGKHSGPKSPEQNAKISATLKGKKRGEQRKVICPHCGKEGGIGAMKHYHFQKCKLKETK